MRGIPLWYYYRGHITAKHLHGHGRRLVGVADGRLWASDPVSGLELLAAARAIRGDDGASTAAGVVRCVRSARHTCVTSRIAASH